MNGILLTYLFLFLMAAIIVILLLRRRGPSEQDFGTLRSEMQALLQAQAQAFTQQVGQINQAVTSQLGQVNTALRTGLADSGLLVSKTQEIVSRELKSSQEVMTRLAQQIGEVQQSGKYFAEAAQTLQNVLGGAKTRGALGEIALDVLLADALPQGAYEMQYRFSNGSIVDAVVRSGERLLPVDSKFPLESYRRMLETGEDSRKEFAQAVRRHADSIAEKYILPDEHTLDVALMFVPSEGVYYELLMTEDSRYGRLDEYCRMKRVLPVSPNTCYAYLSVIAMGLRGMKIEENARRLHAELSGLEKQFDLFAEVYEKLGTHLRHAQLSYEEADRKLERARGSLEQMAQGALQEGDPAPPLLEVPRQK
ncbi:MAG: DNA recombination protein RmuC [Candidatus Acidiferrales bacterium]